MTPKNHTTSATPTLTPHELAALGGAHILDAPKAQALIGVNENHALLLLIKCCG